MSLNHLYNPSSSERIPIDVLSLKTETIASTSATIDSIVVENLTAENATINNITTSRPRAVKYSAFDALGGSPQTIPEFGNSPINIASATAFTENFDSQVFESVVGGFRVLEDGVYQVTQALNILPTTGAATGLIQTNPDQTVGVPAVPVAGLTTPLTVGIGVNLNSTQILNLDANTIVQPRISSLNQTGLPLEASLQFYQLDMVKIG